MMTQTHSAEKKQADRADYIHEVTSDLAKMARDDGLGMLAYILDMARLEACKCLEEGTDRAGTVGGSEEAQSR